MFDNRAPPTGGNKSYFFLRANWWHQIVLLLIYHNRARQTCRNKSYFVPSLTIEQAGGNKPSFFPSLSANWWQEIVLLLIYDNRARTANWSTSHLLHSTTNWQQIAVLPSHSGYGLCGHRLVYLVRSRITGGTRYAGRHFPEQMATRSKSCFARQSGKKHNLLPPVCGARLSKIGRSTICCHQVAVLDCQRCEKVRFVVPCLRCLIVKNGKNCDLLPPACARLSTMGRSTIYCQQFLLNDEKKYDLLKPVCAAMLHLTSPA